MNIKDEILINKYGQGLLCNNEMLERFSSLNDNKKKEYLSELVNLILQSKVKDKDIEVAIKSSNLKPTYTPCVMLKKGIMSHQLYKLIELPDNELEKVLILLISLFKVAYSRRFNEEKNDINKWWYWDLSNPNIIQLILDRYRDTTD